MYVALIVFMVLAGVVSVFALCVIIADMVKGKGTQTVAVAQPVSATQTASREEEQPVFPVAAPAAEESAVADVEEQPSREVVVADENAVVFSAGERQTLDQQYGALEEEYKDYYTQIVNYALTKPNVKKIKNDRYEEYKIGNTRLVRLLIKKGIVVCEFILVNSDFKNFISDNKVRIKHAPTVLRVESEGALEIAKNSIDIAFRAFEEEREYKRQKRNEKRRKARELAEQAAESK